MAPSPDAATAVREFIHAAERLVATVDPLTIVQGVNSRRIEHEGTVQGIKYVKHGAGASFTTPDGAVIDLDAILLGSDGTGVFFEAHRVHLYIESSGGMHDRLPDIDAINLALDDAAATGLIDRATDRWFSLRQTPDLM